MSFRLACAALILAGCASSGSEDPELPRVVQLFDGETLDGWINVNGADSTWTVRDGMIVCSGKPTGVLRSEEMYTNFELELEYRHVERGGNAGLFVWSDPLPTTGWPFTRSVEVQILDAVMTPNYTCHGDIFAIWGATLVPDRPHPEGWMRCLPSEHRAKPAGEWNHYRVRAVDGRIELAVNGAVVSGASGVSPRRGYLCLESEGSEVHFRGLTLTRLDGSEPGVQDTADFAEGFEPLYDGVSLDGWSEDEALAGHWTPRDSILSYDGEGGDLWTIAEYGDFELIADWRWTAQPTDRALPVIAASGEASIDSAGGALTAVVPDAGDSGIYLRGNTKSQVNIWCWPIGSGEVYGYRTDSSFSSEVRAGVTPSANADAPIGEWNRFRIRMQGERLTVDLNGVRVLDDAHLPGVPARGRIGLQNHGAPIDFTNLYVREL
jgi:3-keto-disaccharide hydrolase